MRWFSFGIWCSSFGKHLLQTNKQTNKQSPTIHTSEKNDPPSQYLSLIFKERTQYPLRGPAYLPTNIHSAWNKYFASAGHDARQSALSVGQTQFVPVLFIWYTIEIWKPTGHCDRQKTNPVCHTWNRAGQWPMTGGYFMDWYINTILAVCTC